MFAKLIKRIPNSLLVALYRNFPFTRLKNWIVYRAQQRFLVAVLGVITNDKGEVLLLKHTYRDEPWGIPGGWLELEHPAKGLMREISEETGLLVNIKRTYKTEYKKNPTRIDIIFIGEIVGGNFRASAEISEMQFCTPEQFPQGLPAVQKKLLTEIWPNL